MLCIRSIFIEEFAKAGYDTINNICISFYEVLGFLISCSGEKFLQACGVLYAVEPRDSFLASLCRFTFAFQNDPIRSWFIF